MAEKNWDILKNTLKDTVEVIEEANPIPVINDVFKLKRWNKLEPVYEFQNLALLKVVLGKSLTLQDFHKIFNLPSVSTKEEDTVTISINDGKGWVTFHQLPNGSHQKGRNVFIFFESGNFKYIPGEEYKRKIER